jgi:hypothetical protein
MDGSGVSQYQYPGKIDRQKLIDFCQAELPRLEESNNRYLDALHYAEQGNNIHTIHALNEGLMENYGFQKALKAVCDWAKEHMEEAIPVVVVDIQDLKAKYNG